MVRYQFTPSAVREMRRLPKRFQRQIFDDIEAVCAFTHPLQSAKVIQLRGKYDAPTFRLRSGDYRVIFRVSKGSILIASVRNRKEGY